MNYVHLKIKSLSINRMLRLLVEMELICIKLKVWHKIVFHICRLEILCFWEYRRILHIYLQAIILRPRNTCLIDIQKCFLKIIILINSWKWIAVQWWSQINWALLILCTCWKNWRPVCTILWEVPLLTPRY